MTEVLSYATAGEGKVNVRRRWVGMGIMMGVELLVGIGVGAVFWDRAVLTMGVLNAVALCLVQLGLLCPIVEPRIAGDQRRGWRTWLSASVAGCLFGALFSGIVGMLGDVLWCMNVLPSQPGGKSMHNDMFALLAIAGILVFLVTWVGMTVLLIAYMKGDTEKKLFQVAATLFGGTVVEALSAVGIMAMMNKKSDCVCASFSGITLVSSFALGSVVFGPGVLLLVAWRKSRYRGGRCPACGTGMSDYAGKCGACGVGWKGGSV